MRLFSAFIGALLLAVPAVAQPFLFPLERQRPAEAPPPPPSPVPIAPPQAGVSPDSRVPAQATPPEASGKDNAENPPRLPTR